MTNGKPVALVWAGTWVLAFSFTVGYAFAPTSIVHSSYKTRQDVLPVLRWSIFMKSSPGVSVSIAADFPEQDTDGFFLLTTEASHSGLMQSELGRSSVIVLKVFAPWCRACKALAPKIEQMKKSSKYASQPIQWADLSIKDNKEFVKNRLGILALPTIQIYIGGQLHDSFPCGPSKVPLLKRKLDEAVDTHLDILKTNLTLKSEFPSDNQLTLQVEEERSPSTLGSDEAKEVDSAMTFEDRAMSLAIVDRWKSMPIDERKYYAQAISYLRDMHPPDLDNVLDKAVLRTYPPGTVMMREGETGRTFYLLRSGTVEIYQATLLPGDPMVGTNFLGTAFNSLTGPMDACFGERGLLTGEPRAASIRTATEIQAWILDKTDFPAYCALSGASQGHATQHIGLDEKYGVKLLDAVDSSIEKSMKDLSVTNQKRGSATSPRLIPGVDFEIPNGKTVEDYFFSAEGGASRESAASSVSYKTDNEAILATLSRFRHITQVKNMLNYMKVARVSWGEAGSRNRRGRLVSRLTDSRRAEINDLFSFVDQNKNGSVRIEELQRLLVLGVEDQPSLPDFPAYLLKTPLDEEDFIGIFAEADFYYLFRDIFSSLDRYNSGFVKVADLDRVLSGVRDLISDNRKSLIDSEDQDLLIDYEQFIRLLLGRTLT